MDQSSDAEKSNDEQSVSLPVYTPILAPKLTSIFHEALARWDKCRSEYEAKMEARRRTTSEDYIVVTQNVKETFDSETLTEDELIAEIQGLLGKVKNDDLSNIKDLFASELKMNLKEPDAVELERHFQKNKKMWVTAKHKDKPNTSNPPSLLEAKSERKVEIQADTNSANKADKTHSSRKEPPSPCPKCREMHWLNDCTKATDAEEVELRFKLREANKAHKARTTRLKQLLPASSRTPPLNTPVHIDTFGAHPVTAKAKALLHVMIHTAAGPVQLADAILCMIDTEDDEFIVGHDVLGALGIDVDRQLEQLASLHDGEGSGDPFELEADEPPVIMAQSVMDEGVRAAVETLIDKALENGFPPGKVDKLRVIVHMYDVWRLVLRDDPPA
eukprot:jgi/Phyca11/97306/e_gw1.1.516.1